MAKNIPTLTLSSKATIPVLGYGTWKTEEETYEAVDHALQAGFTHIDCSPAYHNESQVGGALKKNIGTTLPREKLFVTSKLWNTDHRKDRVRPACEKTLKNLKLDYLDLYLIHSPIVFQPGDEMTPKDKAGNIIFGSTESEETWREMEKLVDDGLVKSIGLSNFNHTQIEEILEFARIKPSVLQSECHPYLSQEPMINFCKEKVPSICLCPTRYAYPHIG